ncbi:DMT family transporter [Bacillus sp. DTU_2020_1000418_1_SI_GHA_SEK_038]|uniref:DMT family transporter n=1 Tax=Bacillus sp. DTU_2020_1000418_1_SI_GHA_SEK_038 TaxID=3077585 RepID=UPI0028E30F62|nr:DMT family transporter [Bacillus sp. DTU_2020_1000418_1_SI_GHA_SEK_038]WNS77005.1 DMT family transporter [Bacillus sp. DTU_2020_1000418_1_SI_GHA_SEK_038]
MGKLYSALAILSIIWGTSFLFIKLLLEDLGPAGVVFGRSLFGFLILAIFVLIKREKIHYKELPLTKLFVVGLLNNTLPWLLISMGQTKISSSLASIINATTPIWTLLIGTLFFSTVLRKNQWIGIGLGFIGIFIISDLTSGDLLSGHFSGILFLLGATICYGAGTQLTKKTLGQVSSLHISLFTLFSAALISFFVMLFSSPDSFAAFTEWHVIFSLLGLGSLGSGVAYLLFYYLVKEGGPEFASLVTYLVPGSAILWGAFILGESIHFTMIVGLLIIFLGVYITSTKEKQKEGKAAA